LHGPCHDRRPGRAPESALDEADATVALHRRIHGGRKLPTLPFQAVALEHPRAVRRVRADQADPGDEVGIARERRARVAEEQLEERELWKKYEQTAMEKAKGAGCEIVEIADKKPFQDALKPVWDKYGPKYQAMIQRIQAI